MRYAKQSIVVLKTKVRGLAARVAGGVKKLKVYLSSTRLVRALDPTRKLPVTIEDPLGRMLHIAPDLVDDIQWDVGHHGCCGCAITWRRLTSPRPLTACSKTGSADGRDTAASLSGNMCLRKMAPDGNPIGTSRWPPFTPGHEAEHEHAVP
jgi:hypothetical protein